MIETIKEYLVSLGFSVDKKSFGETTKAVDTVGKSVQNFAGGALRDFAIAGMAVSSFVASSVFGVAKLMDHLGTASIENEKFARQMWISEDSAMKLNMALKATGATLNDLYLSPTLAKQFLALKDEATQLVPPSDYKQQISVIQSIQFEFKRLKLEASYALQWIGYYLTKDLSASLGGMKLSLKDINDWIVKNMPVWTKKVADVMAAFVHLGISAVQGMKDVISVLNKLPEGIKIAGLALTALGLIIKTGPIGIITSILTGALLLFDDFYTYAHGGKSLLGPMWQKLIDFYNVLKDTGIIDKFKNGFKEAFNGITGFIGGAWDKLKGFYDDLNKNGTVDSLKNAFANYSDYMEKITTGMRDWAKNLFSELDKQGVLTAMQKGFEDLAQSVSGLLESVTGLMDKLVGLDGTKTTLHGIGDVLTTVIIVALKTINGLMESIAGYINGISSFLNGTVVQDAKSAGDAASNRLNSQPDQKDKGYWGNLGQVVKDLVSGAFGGNSNFQDRILRAAGNFSNAASNGWKTPYLDQNPGFLLPSQIMSGGTKNITMNQTNNITGSADPNATASAIQDHSNAFMYRGLGANY